jgi:dienelactone hydrolase
LHSPNDATTKELATMKRIPSLLVVISLALPALWVAAQESTKVSKDSRLGPAKNYNGYFPWTPPKSKEEWAKRRQEVREQVLVATGLWPMPEKTPLKPVVHGKIERDGYTIEKVFFASYPGHYVTGSLFRPAGTPDKKKVKYPGVLCPHGHWANGRFFDAGEQAAKAQIKQGAEKTIEGARYPLQARCAQLARMGCVVFHYDMVGYADSKQIGHRAGFTDPEAELRLQSFMGLQTYNSIRALDFLASLPDVDPARIGVTGASGGGTQTFILCAVDDRPAVAFPAVMVSTAMQGGCICENCSYLRIGTGNIELAAIFAPKPLGMSGADDWTKEIETKGLPELQALYRLVGAPDNVMAKAYLQFGHNYNQVSRELMYNFFNRHLKLNQKEPVVENSFVPVPPKELSVFDDQHPVPQDAVDAKGLRQYMSVESDKQLARLMPNDDKSLAECRRVLGTALRVMITDKMPTPADVEVHQRVVSVTGRVQEKLILGRKGQKEAIPATLLAGLNFNGTVTVWIHPEGWGSLWERGKLVPAAQAILDKKGAILAPDVFLTGSFKGDKTATDKGYAGYTFGYNRPLLANRIHDILTAVAYAQSVKGAKKIHLVGFGEAGPWVALARGLCGNTVARTAADLDQFRFENILSMNDDMMLPGALKYGGMPALSALAAPNEIYFHNTSGVSDSWLRAAYKASGHAGNLHWREGKADDQQVVNWLLR